MHTITMVCLQPSYNYACPFKSVNNSIYISFLLHTTEIQFDLRLKQYVQIDYGKCILVKLYTVYSFDGHAKNCNRIVAT